MFHSPGYGGDKGYYAMGHVAGGGALQNQAGAQNAAQQRARDREAAADKATLDALQEVKACIDNAAGESFADVSETLNPDC